MKLFNFNNCKPQDIIPVSDKVMGGVSYSEVNLDSGYMEFQGCLCSQNQGGFTSFKIPWPFSTSNIFNSITLKVKGDGNIYKLRIYTDQSNQYILSHRFYSISDKWQIIKIRFSDLKPVYRGRQVVVKEPIKRARIDYFGILISDSQFGNFNLLLDSMSID